MCVFSLRGIQTRPALPLWSAIGRGVKQTHIVHFLFVQNTNINVNTNTNTKYKDDQLFYCGGQLIWCCYYAQILKMKLRNTKIYKRQILETDFEKSNCEEANGHFLHSTSDLPAVRTSFEKHDVNAAEGLSCSSTTQITYCINVL